MSATANWIEVGALGHAFAHDANLPPASPSLEDFQATIDHAGCAESWRLQRGTMSVDGEDLADSAVIALRPGYFLLSGRPASHPKRLIALALDQAAGRMLRLQADLPTAAQTEISLYKRAQSGNVLSAVDWQFEVGQPANQSPIAPSADLVGIHNRYHYSPHEIYDHIYLSAGFYSWYCVKGAEQGLCDTDATAWFKLADGLYLFSWREKIIPTLGLLLIDLDLGRTSGRIFGYHNAGFDQVALFNVGSVIEPLGRLKKLGNDP